MVEIIDAFPPFLNYWRETRNKPQNIQIQTWASEYMAPWPELLAKQIECYSEDGYDWVEVAAENVFPSLGKRLPEMQTAHRNLTAGIESLIQNAGDKLGFYSPINIVIYVGIGCGAGWATTYQNQPAILFGLENIAEEGWSEPEVLAGLAAHEYGHLAHFHWREQAGILNGSGPWWQLYTEGFAQYCEYYITGSDNWHMRRSGPDDWLAWCTQNKAWLAGEFLRRAHSDEEIRPFFGSWYDLQGYKQCGYYLGYELVRTLIEHNNYKQVAILRDYETVVKEVLKKFAGNQ